MALSALVRKALPFLTLLLVGGSAYQVASGLGRLAMLGVEARSSTAPRSTLHEGEASFSAQRSPRGPASEAATSLQTPRDASRAPVSGLAVASPPVLRDYLAAPDCAGVAVQIVTESADRAWSLASVSVAGEAQARLCRVGDQVGGHRVEFIGFNPRQSSAAVWLSNRSHVCQASLATRGKLPGAEPARAQARAGAAPGDLAAAIAAHVERLSETEVNLSRIAFQTLFENALEVGSRLRIVPEMKDGRRAGLRVFGVRPGTWLSALGLQNGDRVEAINGFDCSPEKLLEAYATLRATSELRVKLTRRGAPTELAVHVR